MADASKESEKSNIKKFKSFEEARRDLWVMNPDAVYFKRLFELFNLVSKLSKRKYPKGLYKFKTFEEARKHREEMERF